jgi:Asp-tRNA(Asn)/Glu-tRNA(Gln) amidotransferase B subunit
MSLVEAIKHLQEKTRYSARKSSGLQNDELQLLSWLMELADTRAAIAAGSSQHIRFTLQSVLSLLKCLQSEATTRERGIDYTHDFQGYINSMQEVMQLVDGIRDGTLNGAFEKMLLNGVFENLHKPKGGKTENGN